MDVDALANVFEKSFFFVIFLSLTKDYVFNNDVITLSHCNIFFLPPLPPCCVSYQMARCAQEKEQEQPVFGEEHVWYGFIFLSFHPFVLFPSANKQVNAMIQRHVLLSADRIGWCSVWSDTP